MLIVLPLAVASSALFAVAAAVEQGSRMICAANSASEDLVSVELGCNALLLAGLRCCRWRPTWRMPTAGGELASDIRDVLARLSPDHRAVLVLRDLEDLDERSAAALLSVEVGTVKSRLHRARQSFRKAWQR